MRRSIEENLRAAALNVERKENTKDLINHKYYTFKGSYRGQSAGKNLENSLSYDLV